MHKVTPRLALDAVCVVEVWRATFDTTFGIKGADNGLADGLGTLAGFRN